MASQSALGWGLWLCGESVRAWLGTVARWPVSLRLIGDCGYVASQSSLGWGLSRGGVAGRYVASQSALDWGDSPLSVAGRCLGESMYVWGWG